MIAWGGEFLGRGRIRELVSLIDIPSTLLDIGGVAIPEHYRGRSLLPLVKGETTDWPEAVFAQISEVETGRCIRTRDYLYSVTAPDFCREEAASDIYVEDKFYVLADDPFQRHNLVTDPKWSGKRAELRETLYAFLDKAAEKRPIILPHDLEKKTK